MTALRGGSIPLLVFGAWLCGAPAPGQAAPEAEAARQQSPAAVRITDLAELVAGFVRDYPDKSDVSHPLYQSAAASVHVHALGFEQTVPLHIHRTTEEATVILTGAPRVTLAFARNGKRATLEQTARPGTLIYSPPFTGHEWFNPDPKGMQANLVFASPSFDGNFYLKSTDRRLLKGGEPLVYDPDRSLRTFLATGRPFSIERLPMRRDKLASVLVSSEATIPAHPVSPTLLYVIQGSGVLQTDTEYPIRPKMLIEIPPGAGIVIRAKPGTPLAIIAFRPET